LFALRFFWRCLYSPVGCRCTRLPTNNELEPIAAALEVWVESNQAPHVRGLTGIDSFPLIFPASEALPKSFDGIQPPPDRDTFWQRNWRWDGGRGWLDWFHNHAIW